MCGILYYAFMRKCVIVINELSGNSRRINAERLKAVFGEGFEVDDFIIRSEVVLPDFSQYDRIVVCGGDGTLHGILNCDKKENAEIIYCPSGTLNELATGNSKQDRYVLRDAGMAGKRMFSYVFACGIFTPLGYVVKSESKKKFKWLAYIARVVGQYKLHRIHARLDVDGRVDEDDYSLIMAIDSPKCFGLKFNRMYRFDDGLLHVLAIKTPKRRGLLGKIEIFFPLFRAFFIGFGKPYRSKKMFFNECKNLTVTLSEKTDFCADGEKVSAEGTFDIRPVKIKNPVTVISQKKVIKLSKKRV